MYIPIIGQKIGLSDLNQGAIKKIEAIEIYNWMIQFQKKLYGVTWCWYNSPYASETGISSRRMSHQGWIETQTTCSDWNN